MTSFLGGRGGGAFKSHIGATNNTSGRRVHVEESFFVAARRGEWRRRMAVLFYNSWCCQSVRERGGEKGEGQHRRRAAGRRKKDYRRTFAIKRKRRDEVPNPARWQ